MKHNKLTMALSAGLLSLTLATPALATTLIPGMLVNDTTLVPIRALSEAMGVAIDYTPSTKQITVTTADVRTVMFPNNPTATINNRSVQMAVAPQLVDGTTYVPIRFVSEAIGATVGYDNATAVITVDLKGNVKTFKLASGNGAVTPEATTNAAEEMFNKAVSGVELSPSLADIPESLFNDMYALDPSTYASYKVMLPQMSAVITEIAVVEATAGNVQAVQAKLQARLDALQNNAFYPSHVEIASKAKLVTKGNFVMMVADEQVATIVANFSK